MYAVGRKLQTGKLQTGRILYIDRTGFTTLNVDRAQRFAMREDAEVSAKFYEDTLGGGWKVINLM